MERDSYPIDPGAPTPEMRVRLADYLAGEGSADERRAIEEWLSENPEHRSVVALPAAVLTTSPQFQRPVDVDAAWVTFARNAALSEDGASAPVHNARPVHARPHPVATRQWRGFAAAALAFGLVIGFIWQGRSSTSPASPNGATHVYATSTGQRATIQLADGSQVTLAPETRLSVPVTFGSSTRSVALVGEAYFEVTKAAGTPFVVRTGTVATQVLGTTFDVKRYANDASARIVVATGKVQSTGTRAHGSPVTLTAGMIGHVTDSTSTITTANDLSAYTGWTQGRLDFRSASVAEMLLALERWYGVRFQLSDSTLATVRVSASFDFEKTSDALDYLKSLLGVQLTFKYRGDTTIVTLHARSARAPIKTDRREWPYSHKSRTEVGR